MVARLIEAQEFPVRPRVVPQFNYRVVRDRRWLISISRMARYHYSVQILGYSVTVSTKHFDCFSLGSNPSNPTRYMVIVAELVKHLIVVQAIVGSSPTFHTN